MPRVALILAVVIALFYGFAATPEELIYDDSLLIGKQTVPRGLADAARIFAEPHYLDLPYYRPLARASYVLQRRTAGSPGPGCSERSRWSWHSVGSRSASVPQPGR